MKFPNSNATGILTGIFIVSLLHQVTTAKENAGVILKRTKRQFELEQGNQVIDSIFQIPIQTLNSVSTLWKNVRPITFRIRQQVLNQYQQYASRPGYATGGYYPSESYSTFQRPTFQFQRPSFNYNRKTSEKRKKPTLDIDE